MAEIEGLGGVTIGKLKCVPVFAFEVWGKGYGIWSGWGGARGGGHGVWGFWAFPFGDDADP